MRLVVPPDPVVGDLELLRGLHVESGDVSHPLVNILNVSVLTPLDPGGLADPVVGGL